MDCLDISTLEDDAVNTLTDRLALTNIKSLSEPSSDASPTTRTSRPVIRKERAIKKPRTLTMSQRVKRYQWHAYTPAEHGADSTTRTARKIHEGEIERKELKADIGRHGDSRNRSPTRVISTTWDLLRALNRAKMLSDNGHTDVVIFCIDTVLLERGRTISCNRIRRALELDEQPLFETENLVWQRIPVSAILTRIKYDTLRESTFAGLFPACFEYAGNRDLDSLRSTLAQESRQGVDLDARLLVQAMLKDLQFSPDDIVCDQLPMVLSGWKLGFSQPKYLDMLDYWIPRDHKSFIDEVDYRLYCASIRRQVIGQGQLLSDAASRHVDVLRETTDRVQSRNLATYEEWAAQRKAQHRNIFEAGGYDEPSPGDFLAFCGVVDRQSLY